MATKLTKPVVREMQLKVVNDLIDPPTETEGLVVVTMTTDGLELRKKGTGRKIFISWDRIGRSIWLQEDAPDAPAKYTNNQLGWLVE